MRGYFSLVKTCLPEIGKVSARCLGETDPSVQLHGAKVKSLMKLFKYAGWLQKFNLTLKSVFLSFV